MREAERVGGARLRKKTSPSREVAGEGEKNSRTKNWSRRVRKVWPGLSFFRFPSHCNQQRYTPTCGRFMQGYAKAWQLLVFGGAAGNRM